MPKTKQKIAIVGMAFRFPGQIDDSGKFWEALTDKRDLVTEISSDRWDTSIFKHSRRSEAGKSYVFSAGQLDRIHEFDAQFFGISPREAAQMDPQQRMLLELAWEALENAAVNPESIEGTDCSVFVGIASNDYAQRRMDDFSSADAYSMTGSTASIASNRLSYVFDLRGPSISVDSACSSSLVALHQACTSIWKGEASHALVGGVNMLLHPFGFVGFSKASMLSEQGRCRAFDADGDGYVRSEGCAVFYLKPLDQAENDGDRIHAVIVNTAVNSDGRTKGITMPSRNAQSALLRQVYAEAGIDVNDIDYIEAHGTGTAVGDPIEASAIGETLAKLRSHKHVLPIGSVKTNIGHMETASGMAGLIKTVLCLKHRAVPANLHFDRPNPDIDFDGLNICVVDEYLELSPDADRPLIAGVNSFGFGGTNSHVVIEEYRDETERYSEIPEDMEPPPLFLSAASQGALKAVARNYADFLKSNSAWYYDIAYQLAHKRAHLSNGLAVKAKSVSAIIRSLRTFAEDESDSNSVTQTLAEKNAEVAFIYSGNGSQWLGMGRQLYAQDPRFAEHLQEVDKLLSTHVDYSLVEELHAEESDSRLHLTEVAQPALFAIQVGVTEWLGDQGLKPKAVAGHSVGEVTAAWVSGALTLKQAVRVIVERSTAQGLTRGTGRMAALGADPDRTRQLMHRLGLETSLEIAGVNSLKSVTLAGSLPALETLQVEAERHGLFFRILDLDYAFHSKYMEPVRDRLLTALESLRPERTRIPMYSTVTGQQINGRKFTAQYWWDNVRQPVAFGKAVMNMIEDGFHVFMDVGPHPIMRGYLNECLREAGLRGMVCPTLQKNSDEVDDIQRALLSTHLAGAYINLDRHFPVPGMHIELPRYAWQPSEFRYDPTEEGYNLVGRKIEHPLLGYRVKPDLPLWENHLDSELVPYLADHVVGRGEVMPAAGFAEMALAASSIWYGTEKHEIEDFEVRAPLLFEQDRLRAVTFDLTADDGWFVVRSRQRLTDDPWTEHAVGRILPQASSALKEQGDQLDVTTSPEGRTLTGSDHYQITSRVGLDYGPCFRAIKTVWVNGQQAIARVAAPDNISDQLNAHELHPCYLDSCFQVLAGMLIMDTEDLEAAQSAMIPVRVGRLQVMRRAPACWLRAMIVGRAPRSLVADFDIFDADGALIAKARNCRFRAVKLTPPTEETSLYEYRPIPKRHPASSLECRGADLGEIVREAAKSLETEYQRNRRRRLYGEIVPLVDTLVACYAHETLSDYLIDQAVNFDELVTEQDIEPRHQTLAARLLHILEEQGWAEKSSESSWSLVDSEQIPDSHSVWLTLLGDYPGYLPELLQLGRAGTRLGDILSGREDSAKMLNPTGASGIAEHLADSALSVQGTVSAAVEAARTWAQSRGEFYRVLHLGSGHIQLCPRLAEIFSENSEYLYVHQNLESCAQATSRLELFANARVANHDFESSDDWSRFAENEGPFDLIIVNESLHNHTHPDRMLRGLRTRMSSQATLLCVERNPSRYADITLGLDDDWWHRTTNPNDPVSLRLSACNWERLLGEAGYTGIRTLNDDPDGLAGPYLVCATNPEAEASVPHPARWLIVTDSEGTCSDLLAAVQQKLPAEIQLWNLQHHQGGVSIDTDARLSRANLLDSTMWSQFSKEQGLKGFDQIVYLCGLDTDYQSAPVQRSEHTMDLRTLGTLNLINALKDTEDEAQPSLTLITCRGNGVYPQGLAHPADAALWGLGRVIRNERPDLRCRQIDLSDTRCDTVIGHLITELCWPTADQEVILSGSSRHILQMQPGEIEEIQTEPWNGNLKLDFSEPGLLKNLHWIPTEAREPSAGQIRVKPMASGLNFRDVMYAMGLLSDEAVESGFSGPTLGMEFAGIVTGVGDDVSRFVEGDHVMGFAPACFSTEIITAVEAAAKIPRNWQFEEAATVPTTFFTAYYALEYLARLQPGERVLIHGGAGGVGIAAIQLAHYLGAEVFATAGTDEKRDFVGFLGADHVLDSRSLEFADEILRLTDNQGIDVVLNSLAGEAISKNLKILRPFGRFLELGKRDFYENSRIALRPFRNNISYFGIDADQLMMEKPELAARLFESLMHIFEEGALRPLPYRSFNATRAQEAFRYMQQARQIGKILLNYNELPQVASARTETATSLDLDPEATYLVTGGTSGFGLETAKWLARKGARHLTLISRSGMHEGAFTEAFKQLQDMDVRLCCEAVDVTDLTSLSDLFSTFGNELPTLKGIIHAAALFDDALLSNLDGERLRRVIDPKVLGGWNLHRLSTEQDLEFFVVYSSISTYIGNPGQGNYVAANTALEALINMRRAAGHPGLAVAWGAIADAGYLARNGDVKVALRERLGASLDAGEALDILERLLASGRSSCAVTDLSWAGMKRFLPIAESSQYRIMNWIATTQGGDEDHGEDIRVLLEGLPRDEALEKITELLAREIGTILRIPADKLDTHASLFDLGMDSLMGVELAMAVEKRFDVNMPAMALSEGPSITRLAERIMQKLLGAEIEESTDETDNLRRLASVHNEEITQSNLEELDDMISTSDSGQNIL